MSSARAQSEGWTSAEPVLTRREVSGYLACGDATRKELPGCVRDGDSHGPLDLLATLARMAVDGNHTGTDDIVGKCLGGEIAMAAQESVSGNRIGRLYGVNIIDAWTDDVSDRIVGRKRGEHAAEVYWNVSTWNPYQVILVKTLLRSRSRP